MSNTRTVLVLMLALLGFMIWNQWQQDYHRPTAPPPQISNADSVSSGTPELSNLGSDVAVDAPTALAQSGAASSNNTETSATPATGTANQTPSAGDHIVQVETDVLQIGISTRGGTIVQVGLPEYPIAVDQADQPFRLLEQGAEQWFLAQSGLIREAGSAPNHGDEYQAQADHYQLDSGSEELRVPLTWEQDGLRVTKWFVFQRGSYTVSVEHQVDNLSGQPLVLGQYAQLQRTPRPKESSGSGFTNPKAYSYFGAAVYDPQEKFVKLPFDDFRKEPYQADIQGGWLAMVQHYFLAAWIPPAEFVQQYSTQEVTANGPLRYRVRYQSTTGVEVPPAGQYVFRNQLYVGPKIQDKLEDVAPGLRYTVDYGVMTFIAKPLFYLLELIHDLVRNWGISIIVLTLLIKLAFFKLTEAQYRSMARMRKLQPRIEALKERYGEDRQKMSQAMMDLYRKEKVNPLGGCLPILIQIPVFISLYWVLLESVELRQAPFLGWIQDLSAKDPYFVLPLLNGIAMIMTQRMTPTPGMDPMQRRIMQSMPVVFSFLFAFFPSGLVLYWATNAISSLAQQWFITRRIEREG